LYDSCYKNTYKTCSRYIGTNGIDFYKYFKLEKTNTADNVCLEYKKLSASRFTVRFYTTIAQEQLAERSGTEMHRSVANIMHAVRVPGTGRVLYRAIWHAIR